MAGVEGVEPSHAAPETVVLPLDDTPLVACSASKPEAQARVDILRTMGRTVKRFVRLHTLSTNAHVGRAFRMRGVSPAFIARILAFLAWHAAIAACGIRRGLAVRPRHCVQDALLAAHSLACELITTSRVRSMGRDSRDAPHRREVLRKRISPNAGRESPLQRFTRLADRARTRGASPARFRPPRR